VDDVTGADSVSIRKNGFNTSSSCCGGVELGPGTLHSKCDQE